METTKPLIEAMTEDEQLESVIRQALNRAKELGLSPAGLAVAALQNVAHIEELDTGWLIGYEG